jgi:divalent metal cation (Fe/Co/Zn/Cd) transporter
MNEEQHPEKRQKLFKWVLALAILTIVYNLAEGLVATYFGIREETLTLFGFGADSFIETISAMGVAQMVIRIRKAPGSERGPFEVTALRITGWCFYALSLILLISAIANVVQGHQPLSTVAGLIIALISILTMWALVYAKLRLGRKLGSSPVIADARCNMVCIYMSVVLLVASALWWLFEIPYVDAAGTLALVYFSVKEGREAFEKARGIADTCC